MIRQLKDYVAVIGITDNNQDNTAVYEQPVQARDAVEAASKVKLTRRQYVSEVRLASSQARVITGNAAGAPQVLASPDAATMTLRELTAQADAADLQAIDAGDDDETFPDEAFKHDPVGPLEQLGIDTLRSIQ